MINKQEILTKDKSNSDKQLDKALRPKTFSEFVGQKKVKKSLDVITQAAKQRNEALDHILIYGPPGLGKTTLSKIIADKVNANIKITSGPAIERTGDLASILTGLEDNDILFIDEIHRLNKTVEEVMYPAMEDFALDLVVGKGPAAKTLRLDLPKFTIIGATTRAGSISSPLRDRFGLIQRLDYYADEEIAQIILRSCDLLNINIDEKAVIELSKRSRKTPRLANRLVKRVRDFAQVKNIKKIDIDTAKNALDMLDIDSKGLDKIDQYIINTIITKFSGGPVGLETLAASISEDIDTICDVYEPYLMQIGFLERTPRGRKVTNLGYKHMGIKVNCKQEKIL